MHDDAPAIDAPPGISGKRITGWVVLGLLLSGVAIGYLLWTYDRIERQRDHVVEQWRAVADELNTRYRQVERAVAEAVETRALPMETGERFQLELDAFRTTAVPSDQARAAAELEELLAGEAAQRVVGSSAAVPSDLRQSLDVYHAERERQRNLMRGLGGRLLGIFIKLPLAPTLDLTEP